MQHHEICENTILSLDPFELHEFGSVLHQHL
jgi:hypothetical protein